MEIFSAAKWICLHVWHNGEWRGIMVSGGENFRYHEHILVRIDGGVD
jgi:hypothetical protein